MKSSKKLAKKLTALFLATLMLALPMMGCSSKKKGVIEETVWYLQDIREVLKGESEAVVYSPIYAEWVKAVYDSDISDIKVMDLTCTAADGILTIKNVDGSEIYTGTYKFSSSYSSGETTSGYTMTLEGKDASGHVSCRLVDDALVPKEFHIFVGDEYALTFVTEEGKVEWAERIAAKEAEEN